MKQLFLTGEMGAGKSTAIARAAEAELSRFGGFFTRRRLDSQGRATAFTLAPVGGQEAVFLDLSGGQPEIHMEVFETLGISALQGDILLLDEIGGLELLSPAFREALEGVLCSDTPVLGVLKGPGPANAMIHKLGLAEEYRRQADRLRQLLSRDRDTLVYPCKKYDEKALTLANSWVREHCI